MKQYLNKWNEDWTRMGGVDEKSNAEGKLNHARVVGQTIRVSDAVCRKAKALGLLGRGWRRFGRLDMMH